MRYWAIALCLITITAIAAQSRVECPECHREIALYSSGKFYWHNYEFQKVRCPMSGKLYEPPSLDGELVIIKRYRHPIPGKSWVRPEIDGKPAGPAKIETAPWAQ